MFTRSISFSISLGIGASSSRICNFFVALVTTVPNDGRVYATVGSVNFDNACVMSSEIGIIQRTFEPSSNVICSGM